MLNWKKINNKMFEEIAYKYISCKYPALDWQPTKATRDGNKDGEVIHTAPLDVTIKYWYEAKYSKNTYKSIPKSHLDSTLVSCLLDGKIAVIAFITNAYISDDYRRRADTFSKQRDNLKIIYVNGEEIEDWLFENPDIESTYFASRSAQKQNFKDYIKTSCILQNFDFCGKQFAKVQNVECGKEYVLYISFYSTCPQPLQLSSTNEAIKLLNPYNKNFDNFQNLNANLGFNSFYIPFQIVYASNKPFTFKLKGNICEIDFTIESISVIDIYNPKIIYGSQLEIQNNLFYLINDKDLSNSLFFIIGNAGYGKSYLLNDIYNNSKNPFSSYVITFSGDEQKDTISCYKIIILSLYGDIWEYTDDILIFQQINTIEALMIQQIKESKVINNSIFQVISHYKNNKNTIEKHISQTQILVDDYHKLSNNNLKLLNTFYQWFMKQKYNCKIFVFTRPEVQLPTIYTKKLEIKNIEPKDIEATIEYNFQDIMNLQNFRNYPIPLNALHFLNILCSIHNYEKDFLNSTELETQIILNDIYANANNTNCLSLGKQIVSAYLNNLIVYCVYKIKTGIPIKAIAQYFGEKSFDEIYDLLQKRIVRESTNIILPYHDILVSAFDTYTSNKMNDELEKFVLFAESNNYISKAKMFSVLIEIGNSCFWKYREEAGRYRDELHNSAEYYQALEIAKILKESNNKTLDNYDFNDCKNLFVLANCIKYTNSYEKANKEFEKIQSVYFASNNSELQGLYLESQTEIVNNLIWMLDVKSAKMRLDNLSLTFEDLLNNHQIVGHHMIYAFLNYYNRLMFVNYMLDNGSEKDYNNALNYSELFNRKEYVAFAKMDYAKSLYAEDLETSRLLIDEALNILSSCNEKRRMLDAESEKCFINDLISKKISHEEYNKLESKIKYNHYIQSEIKIKLKIILLKILFSDLNLDSIRNELEIISINNTAIKSGKRHQAYIYHLYAATYYKENNLIKSRKYSSKSISLLKNMGDTYKFVHMNNKQLNQYNGFILLNEISHKETHYDKFIIDIRLW